VILEIVLAGVLAQETPPRKQMDEYRALLEKATAVLELDGSRATPAQTGAAYEAVGRLVLRHSDILIAIWDGVKPEGEGGTGQIVDEAMRSEIPTLWIHAHAPHDTCVLTYRNNAPGRTPGASKP